MENNKLMILAIFAIIIAVALGVAFYFNFGQPSTPQPVNIPANLLDSGNLTQALTDLDALA